jgi:uncharacterized protein YutE (UPF0331/DUF86 family)
MDEARLEALGRHLEHLRELRPRITGSDSLRGDLSFHNNVLFSLLVVCQLVLDLAGELSARRGVPFEDYTEALHNLASFPEFPEDLVRELIPLSGIRNMLIFESLSRDLGRIVDALDQLQSVEDFARIIRRAAR